MATVSVRVTPRSGTRGLQVVGDVITVRVRSVAEDGKATEEARRVLAEALGIPPSRVSLRAGARSRSKVFDVSGMDKDTIFAHARDG